MIVKTKHSNIVIVIEQKIKQNISLLLQKEREKTKSFSKV